ncbi:Dirigent protein [Thalictrum thalictroides]|uniref:Dirigent protein n=1 Tax=Thalictrum thalictroides TaxID=46969 RepID=A0A7J6WZX3_THATH|nr:Dirigent protein [Thalictrum thalictroides]
MRKLVLVLYLFLLSSIVVHHSHANWSITSSLQDWRDSLALGREKTTRMHFYFHDIVSGKKPTAMKIAQASTTTKSPTVFGIVMMADDPLTEGPEPTSKPVGRAQGLYGSADQEQFALLFAMSFEFTDGIYNGSTLSILGRNPALQLIREMPIVGGTGVFKLARGMVFPKTYWFNATSGDAVVEYHITVIHY